jgi:hypothetical protein
VARRSRSCSGASRAARSTSSSARRWSPRATTSRASRWWACCARIPGSIFRTFAPPSARSSCSPRSPGGQGAAIDPGTC